MPGQNRRAKILIVVGTRPEVIKMAPVYNSLRAEPKFEVQLCASGQHSNLLDTALDDFGLLPDFRLELMEHGQSLGSLTSKAILSLEKLIQGVKPQAVLVHGDTTTTLAASMAAFYLQIPVGHVEAGLRTRNMYSPFPEEFNRQAVSRLARWNFAPTSMARENLILEGIPAHSVYVTGNTVVDALQHALGRISSSTIRESFSNPYVLITFHRRENLSSGFNQILIGVLMLAQANPDVDFIFPVHPNQEVRRRVDEVLGNSKNIQVIDPLGYIPFIGLLSKCLFVISDSGGIQEESVSLGKKILVAREHTERGEALEGEFLNITGTSAEKIFEIGQRILSGAPSSSVSRVVNFTFGDGRAADRITSILANHSPSL
jgi:UDP-N-acetylglucosamine 2-epimerase (non-hydrolysing)